MQERSIAMYVCTEYEQIDNVRHTRETIDYQYCMGELDSRDNLLIDSAYISDDPSVWYNHTSMITFECTLCVICGSITNTKAAQYPTTVDAGTNNRNGI